MSYVELHFHLLPGIDDGPSSIEESLDLARAAVSDGTGTVVVTPHVHTEHVSAPLEIAARAAELADRLRRERIALDVLPGGELAHSLVGRLSPAELDAIAQGPPGRRWLLLEAPFDGFDDRYTAAADELRARGFAVVVAHPERALWTPATEFVLAHELAAGSVLQLTAGSLCGEFNEQERVIGMRLLQSAPRVVIASDAHGATRMPALTLALQTLRYMNAAGDGDPERFVEALPRALLERGLSRRPLVAPASRA